MRIYKNGAFSRKLRFYMKRLNTFGKGLYKNEDFRYTGITENDIRYHVIKTERRVIMARNRNPRFKESRRLGVNIYGHPKAMDRYRKGMGRGDKKLSTYGEQLLQKQRLKAYYGVLEKQMRRYMDQAKKGDDITGDELVRLLETRLDNMVYRMGFASSIRQARQMVVHRHIQLNGKRVDRPSHKVKVGDQVVLKESSREIEGFKNNFEELRAHPSYISRDVEHFTATLIKDPDRDEIPVEVNDQLVVEYYTAL